MKNLKLYDPFLWMGFNCLKAIEPLSGNSLLFTTQFPKVYGTHLTDPRRMKGWELTLEPPSGFEPETPRLGIQCPNDYDNWEDIC